MAQSSAAGTSRDYPVALRAFVDISASQPFGVPVWPIIVFLLTLGDLFFFGRGYNPAIRLAEYFPSSSVTEFLQGELRDQHPVPFRVLPLEEEFPPNVLAQYAISDVRNYDAIESRDSLAFFRPLWADTGRRLTSATWTPWDRIAEHLWLLRQANVRYLISTADPLADLPNIRLVHEHGRVRVYEIDSLGPLTFAPAGADEAAEMSPVPATIFEYAPGRVVAEVSVPGSGGRLVLSETFMPGWKAWVDGKRLVVYPHEGVFLGVSVPPGSHRVVFEYRPASFWYGLCLSAVGLVGMSGLFLTGAFDRRMPLRLKSGNGAVAAPSTS